MQYMLLLLVFVSQSHVRAHLLMRTIILYDHSIGWNLSLFFFYCLRRSSHVLADFAIFSRTKWDKEGSRAKSYSRADSALAAARANRNLRGNYAKCDSSNAPCLRKHARAYSVHCAALDVKWTGDNITYTYINVYNIGIFTIKFYRCVV